VLALFTSDGSICRVEIMIGDLLSLCMPLLLGVGSMPLPGFPLSFSFTVWGIFLLTRD
jgi:hypothetical protein